MKQRLALVLLLICSTQSFGQQFTVSGTITDLETGEFLIGASVYDTTTLNGTSANSYGFFSLKIVDVPAILNISYVGYEPQLINMTAAVDTVLNLSLSPVIDIGEVKVTGNSVINRVMSTQMGKIEIPVAKIKYLPSLMGETDLIKAMQLLPGVQSGMEGSSGIYVRGGGADQNLILLDGVPVYNANHLFGFFSVFNSDAIQNISLIKGGFPARYGGRLSSVIDIRMKEGNMKQFRGEGSVGIISSKLTLEGPIKKGKTSFIVSGRRTYADLLSIPFQKASNRSNNTDDYSSNSLTGYYFYDLNAKINHRFSDRSRLYFSIYSGKDRFYLRSSSKHYQDYSKQVLYKEKEKNGLDWGNLTSVLRWNYFLRKDIFSNLSVTISDYRFSVNSESRSEQVEPGFNRYEETSISYLSGIRDYGAKWDINMNPAAGHSIRVGLGDTYHVYRPGVTVSLAIGDVSNPIDTTFGNINLYSNEFYIYGEDDFNIGTWLKVNGGVRYSNYLAGHSTFHSLEPRLSARIKLSPSSSLKASYTAMTQYIHLLTNNTLGLPTDLWVPAMESVEPQKARQVALGLNFDLGKSFELSVEAYYKQMEGLIEYKEGASFFNLDSQWFEKIESGSGIAKGIELFLQKTEGRTTGWIGYTLSRSIRRFDGISRGNWFPYKYDQVHDLSIVVNHRFNDKIDIGATWVFGSGTAVSIPADKYLSITNIETVLNPPFHNPYNFITDNNYWYYIENNETRNSSRMPAYHRLDIGINFRKKKKWGERTLSTGAYNVYNRLNAFYMYVDNEWDWDPVAGKSTSREALFKVTIFPVIPYIKYSFKF